MKPDRVILISINPKFVTQILSNEKKIEFRKSWSTEPVKELVIYATSPVKKIIAIAKIAAITKGTPIELLELAFQKGDRVEEKLVNEYFLGKEEGIAIEITNIRKLHNEVDPKKIFTNFHPPQSFKYLNYFEYNKIIKEGLI